MVIRKKNDSFECITKFRYHKIVSLFVSFYYGTEYKYTQLKLETPLRLFPN